MERDTKSKEVSKGTIDRPSRSSEFHLGDRSGTLEVTDKKGIKEHTVQINKDFPVDRAGRGKALTAMPVWEIPSAPRMVAGQK